MKLKQLIKDIPGLEVKGSKEIEITGIEFITSDGFEKIERAYFRDMFNQGFVSVN